MSHIARIIVLLVSFCHMLDFSVAARKSTKLSGVSNSDNGFYNHSGCLYAYMEGATFDMITADGLNINEDIGKELLTYDKSKTQCLSRIDKKKRDGEFSEAAKLVFSFRMDDRVKSIKLISISMRIVESKNEGYWEISQANMTITRADIDKKRTFRLKLPYDVSAGLDYSYSCNRLTLHTLHRAKTDNETSRVEPHASISLLRFQVQPFGELRNHVFAASFDCSRFVTLPLVMGSLLVGFMILVCIVGVYNLVSFENIDFKFSKESISFTQSQRDTHRDR